MLPEIRFLKEFRLPKGFGNTKEGYAMKRMTSVLIVLVLLCVVSPLSTLGEMSPCPCLTKRQDEVC